ARPRGAPRRRGAVARGRRDRGRARAPVLPPRGGLAGRMTAASWIPGVRGALVDVDGTLLRGDEAIPGAARALARMAASGVRVRLTTNTTRRSRAAVVAALRAAGIETGVADVVSPAVLARRRILASGARRAALLVPPATREDLAGVEEDA